MSAGCGRYPSDPVIQNCVHHINRACTHHVLVLGGEETEVSVFKYVLPGTMNYILDEAPVRRDKAVTRQTVVRRSEVHGKFTVSHLSDTARFPHDVTVQLGHSSESAAK